MDDRPHAVPQRDPVDATIGGRRSARTVGRRTALALGGAGLAAAAGLDWLPTPGALGAVTLDARDYGATGNGTADDTAAVQRLIDEAARQGAIGLL
ncbi:MAG TPA: hypothetical protein VGB58_02480, partial [Blastococcus sp.]